MTMSACSDNEREIFAEVIEKWYNFLSMQWGVIISQALLSLAVNPQGFASLIASYCDVTAILCRIHVVSHSFPENHEMDPQFWSYEAYRTSDIEVVRDPHYLISVRDANPFIYMVI